MEVDRAYDQVLRKEHYENIAEINPSIGKGKRLGRQSETGGALLVLLNRMAKDRRYWK